MVFCAVYGCSHRNERDICSFFRIPTVKKTCTEELKDLIKKRRYTWILRINRKDFTEMKANYARVCSDHFISGKPSKLRDINSPDWAPSLNLGYDDIQIRKRALSRYNRLVNQAPKVTNSTVIENEKDNIQETSCNSLADLSSLSASISYEEVIPVSNQIFLGEASTANSLADLSWLSASISNEEEEKSDEPGEEIISDSSSTKSVSPERKSNLNDIRNCSDVEKDSDIEDIEKTRKKRKVDRPSHPENTMDMPEVLSAQNNFLREDIFGQYVASEIRALKDNPLLYLQTKQSILEILTSAHLEYLNPE